MTARRVRNTNNHLQEAIALLISNQAAFVAQLAENDKERLKLQRRSDEFQVKTEDWQRRTEDWQRKTEDWQRGVDEWRLQSDKRFEKIEERLDKIEADLLALPNKIVQTILDQLPKIKKEIGFVST